MNFFYQIWYFLTAPIRWFLRLPSWMLSAPGKFFGFSVPMRVALFTAAMLVGCVISAIILAWVAKDAAALWNWFARPVAITALVLLLILIPIVVYYLVKYWLEGDPSRYPDIDEAWQEGVEALEEQGVDLTNAPLFLVLGSPDETSVKNLFSASSAKFIVNHTPRKHAPLHWYADEDSVYLVCMDTSYLSSLNRAALAMKHTEVMPMGPAAGEGTVGGIGGTIMPGDGGAGGGTIMPGGEGGGGDYDAPSDDYGGGGPIMGTIMPNAGTISPGVVPSSQASQQPATKISLPRFEADEQLERLEYVCQLICRARQSLCPLNGVLTLLPFRILSNELASHDMPAAVREDLQVVLNTTRLRCPVTALVTGMEAESGFAELVNRVGSKNAREARFGKGFNPWNPPTGERIDAFSSHACGAFEDWAYNLFRERGGLTQKGNSKLYMLLCKIRSRVRPRLKSVLLHGYSFDPNNSKNDDSPLLFGGCYFAATGDSANDQAFVKSVFAKMVSMEEDLEWTDEAWDENESYQTWRRVGTVLNVLLLGAIVGMLVYKFIYAPDAS